MTSDLHLGPVRPSAAAIDALPALRDQASRPEQVRPDLALFELADAPRKIVLPKVQRQLPQILTLERQDVERVELHLVVMLA